MLVVLRAPSERENTKEGSGLAGCVQMTPKLGGGVAWGA